MTKRNSDALELFLENADETQLEAVRTAYAGLMQLSDDGQIALLVIAGLVTGVSMAVFLGKEADIAAQAVADAERNGLLN